MGLNYLAHLFTFWLLSLIPDWGEGQVTGPFKQLSAQPFAVFAPTGMLCYFLKPYVSDLTDIM